MDKKDKNILWLSEIGIDDVGIVGGKNGSLGEMYNALVPKGVNTLDGFALTTNFYWEYMKANGLDKTLVDIFKGLDAKSIKSIQEIGKKCREAVLASSFPENLKKELFDNYAKMAEKYGPDPDVAVRTSGVAEDRPNASFAGQFETYLNVRGNEAIQKAVVESIISTFTDRAIAYRDEKEIGQMEFGLSIGVYKMIRSDLASAGIMFTLDTETGFDKVILINSIWGLGELIVKGRITPDEFYVHKPTLAQGYNSIIVKNLGRKTIKYVYSPKGGLKEAPVKKEAQLIYSLTDEEVITLAKWAVIVEEHYTKKFGKWMPQDLEWAKDGESGKLYIVQSRPETVQIAKSANVIEEYQLETTKEPIVVGTAIGEKIGSGKVKVIEDVSKISEFQKGDVLVTKMTDPDWVPVMRIASAIVTDEGGKTCHAAIVSRELGVPAIVGSETATKVLKKVKEVTVDCSSGSTGKVFSGIIPFKINKHDLSSLPEIKTKIMMNIGDPRSAFKASFLPNSGVGLAREEFIIAEKIKVHPMALYDYEKIKDKKLKKQIAEITVEHKDKKDFFIKELAEGIAQIAAAVYPKEIIVRFSDFKTNEYNNLVGGKLYEAEEPNPMMGFRGASRYISPKYQPAFLMECEAIKRVRDVFGLKNVDVMIPFCRTLDEGRKVVETMASAGLTREKEGVKIFVMCEIPANVILAEQFLEIFDGFSIGSNDLTQLTLGLDRDNGTISYIADERNGAVLELIEEAVRVCKAKGKYIGICGEAPSNYPDFAEFLVDLGIESMSLNPNVVLKTHLIVAEKEKQLTTKK